MSKNSGVILAAVGLLALAMGGKKKGPPRGTVTPLDDELVQVRPSKPKPLADELSEMADPEPAGPPASSTPLIDVDRPAVRPSTDAERVAAELFAATAVQQSQLPPPAATATPVTSQKEASPFRPPPPLPTAPAPASAAPAPKVTTTGPIIDVVYDPEVNGPRNVSPVLQPKSQGPQIPAGYDPAKARATAPAIASMLAKKGPSNYARAEMKGWQKLAALTPDGLYGGSTRGALIHFGVKDPPRPFFKPVATIPYTPPEQRV